MGAKLILVLAFCAVVASSSPCLEGWTHFKGTCYYYDPAPIEPSLIEPKCKALGASLVQIKSQDEILFMFRNMTVEYPLLGTKKISSKEYRWADGSPIPAGFWQKGYPSCNASCCTVSWDGNGFLLDYSCSIPKSTLCSKPEGAPINPGVASKLQALREDLARGLSALKAQVDGVETQAIAQINELQ